MLFPFADGIKTLINAGVKIIVQPGGSIRDKRLYKKQIMLELKWSLLGQDILIIN